MEINLDWEHFKSPTVDVIRNFGKEFPQLKEVKLDNIKTRFAIHEGGNEIKSIEFIMNKGNDLMLISELKNQILAASFNLKHLWFYQSLKPLRFGSSEQTAASVYYETYYEAFYSKLSSSFDYFLQLVNLYYALELNIDKVKVLKVMDKLKKFYKNDILSELFSRTLCDENQKEINEIRNSFIHRKSVFNEYFVFEENNVIDNFNYNQRTTDAIEHFTNHINFLNNQAFPFLYKFKDYKKVI